jgi:uncharacterized membrane protein
MKFEYVALFLFGIYLLYYLIAVYNGVAKMKDKKSWYLVNESVLKILIVTAMFLGILFMLQTYRVDYYRKELSIYESKN